MMIYVIGIEPITDSLKTIALPDELNVKLRIYLEVLLLRLHTLLRYEILHSDCLSPCEILNHASGLAPIALPLSSSTLMVEHRDYQLIVRTSCFGLLWNRTPILLIPHRTALGIYPFGP